MFPCVVTAYSPRMVTCAETAAELEGSVRTSVFLVEDAPVIRERLLQLLEAIPGVTVIGHAETPGDAIEQIGIRHPRVVVLDIKLRGGSGIEVLQAVKQHVPATVVIMLTNYAIPEFRERCLRAGADYFLDKTNEFQKIASILGQLNCSRR
jgi:DNA-binding NarL/FixJ family response regulator